MERSRTENHHINATNTTLPLEGKLRSLTICAGWSLLRVEVECIAIDAPRTIIVLAEDGQEFALKPIVHSEIAARIRPVIRDDDFFGIDYH